MPRVTTVTKARKDQGTCGKCSEPLPAGSSYRWWKFRYGGRRVRCMKPSCSPRSSDLTSSDKLGRIYMAQEMIEDAMAHFENHPDAEALSDLESAIEEAAGLLDEVADDYEESADNIEDGFGHATMQSDEIREKADTCRDAAMSVEGVALPEWDLDEDDYEDSDEFDDAIETLKDEIMSAAEEAKDACDDAVI